MKNTLVALFVSFVLTLTGCASSPETVRPQQSDSTADAYSALGMQYLQSRDIAAAKATFQKALNIVEYHAGALNGLALVFQIESEKELARSYFERATDADPQSALIHNNFGAFLFSNGEYEQACSELERATEDPFYTRRAQAFENLGLCYRKLDRVDAAKHAYSRALQINGNRPRAMVELAELHFLDEEYKQANLYFSRFTELVDSRGLEHYPKSLWVGIQLARYNGNSGQAVTYALLLKNLFPQSDEYSRYQESMK